MKETGRRLGKENFALLLILVLVAAFHLYWRSAEPAPKLIGDEVHYFAYAKQDRFAGETSLFPGRQRFDHRPELASRVLSRLVDGEPRTLTDVELEAEIRRALEAGEGSELVRRAGVMNLVFLLLLLVLVHGTGRLLGLSPLGALVATALLGFSPWLGFHVHSLWPEVLHASLFGVAVLCTVVHLKTRRIGWLFPAGLVTGMALFAKSTLLPFVPIAVLFLVAAGWWFERGHALPLRVQGALGPGLLYGASILVFLFPQLLRNASEGHGVRLSANRWWNLELGLVIPYSEIRGDAPQKWKPVMETSMRYWQSGNAPDEREAKAKERTLAHLRETGIGDVLWNQTRKLWALVLFGEPFFEQALTYRERWGPAPPDWLAGLVTPGRVLWYATLLLALLGFPWAFKRGSDAHGWRFLAVFVAYMGVAVFLVPVKMRFLLPVLPALCLFAGGGVDWMRLKLASRR